MLHFDNLKDEGKEGRRIMDRVIEFKIPTLGSGAVPDATRHPDQETAIPNSETRPEALWPELPCLTPFSGGCFSRLFRLWQGPEAAVEANPSEGELELSQLGKFFLQETFGGEIGAMLHEGLSRYFSREPESTPRPPEAECEVRKSPEGEIRVECTAR